MDRELNSFRRMIEAAAKVTESYSMLRTKRGEILCLQKTIKTLNRVILAWESKFKEQVQDLLGELQKPAPTDRKALQNAGFVCNCSDLNCKILLEVDDKHYVGFLEDVEEGNIEV
ncbi:hypothetical protein M758_UG152300 [Ceratodon purpureus]|nr:hypothetical protein M758_UG152300 [Ceratodon purpureus]